MNWQYALIGIAILLIIWHIPQPSNDRNWHPDQEVLAYAVLDGNLAHVYNVRNITYRGVNDYDVHYYDRTYNLNKLAQAYYAVIPFGKQPGAAHTILSFEFTDGKYLALSVEIRKEANETYSALKGLFKQYELMYVLADEQDVIKLRTNHRKNDVFLYPSTASKEKIRAVFIDILERVNKLKAQPEFYNTFFNSCTQNLAEHVNHITPHRIPLDIRIYLPAYSDTLAYELGLINNSIPFQELREQHYITKRAQAIGDDPNFSELIRQ